MSIFQDAETACLDEEQGYTIRQLGLAALVGLLWLIREGIRRVIRFTRAAHRKGGRHAKS